MEREWHTLKIPSSSGWSFPPSPSHSFDTLMDLCNYPVAPPFSNLVILPWLSFCSSSDPLLYTSPTILVWFCFFFQSSLLSPPITMTHLLCYLKGFWGHFPHHFKTFALPHPIIVCILLFGFWSSHRLHMTHAPSTALRTLMTQTP